MLRKLNFLPEPLMKLGLLLMVSFSSTPNMESSKTTSQAPQRRSPGLFTNFHEEDTVEQPPKPARRSPSKSNKLTFSHSNYFFFRNGGLTPNLYIERMHIAFLLDYLNKTYKRITNIRQKPPSQRQIAKPTKLMKGVTMNRAMCPAITPTCII
jgi:hypothetical protein